MEEEEVSDSEQVISRANCEKPSSLHDFASIGFLESDAMRRNHNSLHHRHQNYVKNCRIFHMPRVRSPPRYFDSVFQSAGFEDFDLIDPFLINHLHIQIVH